MFLKALAIWCDKIFLSYPGIRHFPISHNHRHQILVLGQLVATRLVIVS